MTFKNMDVHATVLKLHQRIAELEKKLGMKDSGGIVPPKTGGGGGGGGGGPAKGPVGWCKDSLKLTCKMMCPEAMPQCAKGQCATRVSNCCQYKCVPMKEKFVPAPDVDECKTGHGGCNTKRGRIPM